MTQGKTSVPISDISMNSFVTRSANKIGLWINFVQHRAILVENISKICSTKVRRCTEKKVRSSKPDVRSSILSQLFCSSNRTFGSNDRTFFQCMYYYHSKWWKSKSVRKPRFGSMSLHPLLWHKLPWIPHSENLHKKFSLHLCITKILCNKSWAKSSSNLLCHLTNQSV